MERRIARSANKVEAYLRGLAGSNRSLARQLAELLERFRAYHPGEVARALQRALAARAFGADYVARTAQSSKEPSPHFLRLNGGVL